MILGRIRGFFEQKQLFQEEHYQKRLYIESGWQNFLNRDTYLVYNVKKSFLKEIDNLYQYPWHYWLDIRLFFKKRKEREEIPKLKHPILSYNENFISRRLIEYKSFFDGKEGGIKHPLDENQRIAIIKDDKHNLVIAGAGSGKTSVLTSRIAYLIRRKDRIKKDRILALAFTRAASDEMRKRLKSDFNIETNIFTFHKLGKDIIQEVTSKNPKIIFNGNEKKRKELICKIFNKMMEKEKYQEILIEYLTFHIDKEVTIDDFKAKEEYYEFMRTRKYLTLNNTSVKSLGERDIANFLFRQNIEFEYELSVPWIEEEDIDYTPDFYLPQYDIYIEHWGLNEEYEVPEWFSISSKEYLEERDWKIQQYEKHDKILVETWDYERKNDCLLFNLENRLKDVNEYLKFIPLTYEELVEMTYQFKENKDEIGNLIWSFIESAKSNRINTKRIEKRIKSDKYTKKQKIFAKLAVEAYRRYQNYLKKYKLIDFNDMINNAVDYVIDNPSRFQNRYDHVLIDEFQDISYQRLQLIRNLVPEKTKNKLFCVGDDWQTIYQFTGSDVRYLTEFQEYFSHPEITYLEWNYRSSKTIVEMSNELISFNKDQIWKELASFNVFEISPSFFLLSQKYSYAEERQKRHVYNLINNLINQGVQPREIMVLSRFNFSTYEIGKFCAVEGLPVSFKNTFTNDVRFLTVHKSKGLESKHVIIIDLISGVYGFPCEIEDSSIMAMAKRNPKIDILEEERRLFYVALTRSKEFIYIYSREGQESVFLDEIQQFLSQVRKIKYIDFTSRKKRKPKLISDYS
ncbi:MAG: UvrD-helicase domain-containing protein [Candidatus Hodarchaeales archaeon]|jgi:DNA helicase-4